MMLAVETQVSGSFPSLHVADDRRGLWSAVVAFVRRLARAPGPWTNYIPVVLSFLFSFVIVLVLGVEHGVAWTNYIPVALGAGGIMAATFRAIFGVF